MSFSDWVALVGATLITVLGWVQIVRVWHHKLDIGWFRGVRPGTPESAGHHAAMGAIYGFCTVGTVVVWGLVLNGARSNSETVNWVLWWVLVAGFACWPLAGLLYVFLRPRFLVPPHMRRSQSLASAWCSGRQQRRADRRSATGAAPPVQRG